MERLLVLSQTAVRRLPRTQMPLRGDRLKMTTTLRETLSA